MSPTMQSHSMPEESYCAPWDLRVQEEKLRLLNEHHQTSSIKKNSNTTFRSPLTNQQPTSISFHRTSSVRGSSKLPSEIPILPSRDFIANYQSNNNPNIKHSNSSLKKLSNCFNTHTTRTGTILSPKKVISKCDNQSMSFETALLRFKCLSASIHNNSLPKPVLSYEQPWHEFNAPHLHNRHGRSLQKLPNTEEIQQHCMSPAFSSDASYRQADDLATVPIERYFWYHSTMTRRQAESILECRPSGSFLVRQSESGKAADYSLSIKTPTGCMHMRICYCNGFYVLGECSRPFSSVAYMIKYFSQISVPIRGAPHIKLGTPVSRNELLSTSLISTEELL
ncbi:unnamed protein product [Adineta ricciae]|uniref:SH2 domain-containing protein n=1 Tax=Adineta ricciae TaxID=249248 RepID=A0A814EY08_ADIRI|nr:unnamed protein product [Adineta ricciae]